MKKVLIIGLTERMGGVETFIYNTTIFSDKDRYRIDFLAHGTDHVLFQKEIGDFYGEDNHFFFVSQFKSHPIKSFFQLCKFYRKHRYDIIHLQTGATFEVVYCFPFALFQKAKVIAHSHNGNGFSGFVNAIFRPLLNFVCHKRLACSKVAASWLFGSKYVESTDVVKNGIDVDKFAFREDFRSSLRSEYSLNDKFVVGHIGRFSEQKNHVFLLKIFQEILKKKPNAVLFLIGSGELYDSVMTQIEKMKLMEHIIHVKNTNEAFRYYCMFDCFLMPSLYEGLPIVGVEAQTSGLQCFFSENISPEINLTDHCNIKSLNESAEQWADAIVNADYRENRLDYSNKIREKGFDIRMTTEQIAKIYSGI